MKNIVRLSVLGLSLAGLILSPIQAHAKNIQLYVDGNPLHTEASPLIANNRTLVPARSLSQALGYRVSWFPSQNRISIFCPEGGSLSFYPNQTTYYLNGVKRTADVAPQVIGDTAYIPVRVLTESFGLGLEDRDSSQSLDISISRANPVQVIHEPAHVKVIPEPNQVQVIRTEAAPLSSPTRVDGKNPIEGRSVATAEQMAALLLAKNPNPRINCSALELAQLYLSEGEKEGIRGDFAFAQAIKETGYFRYGGDVLPEQNNYAGIGTVGGGVKGAYFPSPQIGVRVQIQHLKAYASTQPLNQDLVDPRYHLVDKGSAPTLEDLNGRWAVPGHGYGQSILSIYQSILSK